MKKRNVSNKKGRRKKGEKKKKISKTKRWAEASAFDKG